MSAPINKYSASTLENQIGTFNQIVTNGNFASSSGWGNTTTSDATLTVSNGVLKLTTKTAKNLYACRRTISIPNGHVIFYSYYFKITSSLSYTDMINAYVYSSNQYFGTGLNMENYKDWRRRTGTVTCTSAKTYLYLSMRFSTSSHTLNVGDYGEFKNVWITDLTDMFGAGNEPDASTFLSMWPEDYYPYAARGTWHQIYARMPLALSEYSSDALFRQKFYVHDVWHLKDASNNETVLGLLNPNAAYVTTDFNAMHANKRKGKLTLVKEGIHYVVLNDGGLNTLPEAYFSSNILSCYTNYVKVYCYLKSAYYIQTDCFTIDFYLVSGSTETWQHSVDLAVGSDEDDLRILPANTTLTQFVAGMRNISGFSEGDTMRLKITAINEEGEYLAPVYKDAIVKKAMMFVQLYYFAVEPNRTTTDPTTGTPYAMLIDENMYSDPNPNNVGDEGILYTLLHGEAGDHPVTVQTSERFQGAFGTVEDAYGSVIADSSDGWYYGISYPDYAASGGFVYMQISNSGTKVRWWPNNYNPVVPTAYTITMTLTGHKNMTTQKYEIYLNAQVSGTVPNGGVTISSNMSNGTLNPRTNMPEHIYWSGEKHVSNTGTHTLNTYAVELDEGDLVASWGTSGYPASTTTNYVTEALPREVNGTNFPT